MKDGVFLNRTLWQDLHFSGPLYNCYQFQIYHIAVDSTQERNVGGGNDATGLPEQVDRECPVALQLGGIHKGFREGVVWVEETFKQIKTRRYVMRFKSVGSTFRVSGPGNLASENMLRERSKVTRRVLEFQTHHDHQIPAKQNLETDTRTVSDLMIEFLAKIDSFSLSSSASRRIPTQG